MGSRGLMGQWGGVQTKGRTGEEKPLGKRAAGPSRPGADTGCSVCLAAARTVTNRPTIVPWSQPFVPVTPPPPRRLGAPQSTLRSSPPRPGNVQPQRPPIRLRGAGAHARGSILYPEGPPAKEIILKKSRKSSLPAQGAVGTG